MARAIGIPSGDLDNYMRADWSPEDQDAISEFLAYRLDAFAAGLINNPKGCDPKLVIEIQGLAAQYRAPRHRPVVEAADTDEFIVTIPDGELVADGPVTPMPEWQQKMWAEVLDDAKD
jgi:hypothetical protein